MSYTVLARRYRSATFDQIVGQQHIAQTLKKAIESSRLAHAFLFCGTRGTGKTSMARILAKALNCQAAAAPTPNPCGTCDTCQAIARGEDIDVIEIDAASHTGVDNVREIIENSQYRPARSRFKVYIIDEVHMLSKSAFNALLKTLEEPPEHVKFVLATTEPEKVLPTILSRCQRYDFRDIAAKDIAAHLKDICKKEKIEAEDDALALIARAGAGSMRDALSLLDRLLSLGETHLSSEMIQRMLGLPRSQLIWQLAEAIGSGDAKGVLCQVQSMISSGLSPDVLLAALTDHLRNLLIARTCGPDSDLLDVPGVREADLAAQAAKFDPLLLTQDIAILEELRRNLRHNQTGRAVLDATLLRLTLAEQFASISRLLSGQTPDAVKKKPPHAVEAESPASLFAAATPVEATSSAPSSPQPGGEAGQIWSRLLEMIRPTNSALAAGLSLAELAELADGQAVIRFNSENATFAKMWSVNGKRETVAHALSQLCGQDISVRFEVAADPADPSNSPHPSTAPNKSMPPPEASPAPPPPAPRVSVEIPPEVKNDPLVQAVLNEFGGEIIRSE
ncbi:MAG: DNA polymerase III subunit gamma/tau [Tepidisphaeraceae bacterium]|jgi:DNA polymerase-3 subunit gamma/tau